MKKLLQTIAKASTRRVTFSGGPPEEGEEVVGKLTGELLQFYVIVESEKAKTLKALEALQKSTQEKQTAHAKLHAKPNYDSSGCDAFATDMSEASKQKKMIVDTFNLLKVAFYNMVRLEFGLESDIFSISIRDGGQIAIVRKPAEEEFNPLHELMNMFAGYDDENEGADDGENMSTTRTRDLLSALLGGGGAIPVGPGMFAVPMPGRQRRG